MRIQKVLGALFLIAGAVVLVLGWSADGDSSGAMVIIGVTLAFIGAVFLLVSLALNPLMKSSRELAEAQGMEVSKLTGAPKLGSSLQRGRDQMAVARQQMANFTGQAAVRAGGEQATAVVTSATDTGEVSNLNPVYDVGLTVTPEDGVPYDTTVRTEINTLAVAKAVPGTSVPVTIPAGDRSQVLIDWVSVI